jgi:hypothetical protein
MLNRLRRKKIAAYRRYPLSALPREMRIKDVVAHLFDYHVMEKADWTLDRLTTWLQPLEPNEPAEASSIGGKRDLPPDDAEWRETRQAFEAKMKTKRHRFAGEAD